MTFPRNLTVLVEQPRASFVKRREDGGIDFVSPLPCPFNYGSVPGTRAADGDREDVVVLGPRLAKGVYPGLPVLARAHFIDAGQYDGKWVCSQRPQLRPRDRQLIVMFFAIYALCKGLLNRLRGRPGATRFGGLEIAPPSAAE